MQKLNKYLLLHYPQIWNLRVAGLLITALVIHLLFYVSGFLSFGGNMQNYHVGQHDVDGTNIVISVMISVLIIILWLVFYLRNNPFKSFYPLPKEYFVVEFTSALLLFVLFITFYNSFSLGHDHDIKLRTGSIDLNKQIKTLNIGYAFTPIEPDRYKDHATCDSTQYIDSLLDLRSKLREIEGYSNDYEATAIKKGDSTADTLRMVNKAIEEFNAREGDDYHYSYLNFCYAIYNGEYHEMENRIYYNGRHRHLKLAKGPEVSAEVHKLLLNHDTAGVRRCLSDLHDLFLFYGIYPDFDVDRYARAPFERANFELPADFKERSGHLSSSNMGSGAYSDLERSIDKIVEVRNSKFDWKYWSIQFYVGIAFALILFTFRATPVRRWFGAIIGGGVIFLFTMLTLVSMHGGQHTIPIGLFLLGISFYPLHFLFKQMQSKLLANLSLVWFTWSLPFLQLLLSECFYTSPFKGHELRDSIIYLGMIYLFTILVLSRNYRQLMAMADE